MVCVESPDGIAVAPAAPTWHSASRMTGPFRRTSTSSGSRSTALGPMPPARIKELLRDDPAFKVMSVDGLAWIDPWTGTAVPAPFGPLEPALAWLSEHQPWKSGGQLVPPRPLSEVQLLRWLHWLRSRLPEPECGWLRQFATDGRWLNPFTGDLVAGIPRPDGAITNETLKALAGVLRDCPQAVGGRPMDRAALERRMAELSGKPRSDRSPSQANPVLPVTPSPRVRPGTGVFTKPVTASPANASTQAAVRVVNGYRVLGELGRGGMSTVYRAIQLSMEREVALKVLDHHGPPDQTYIERFLREARAVGRINHPHVVTCFDVGVFQGKLFMALELMTGGDAWALVARRGGRLGETEALTVVRDATAGLCAVHAAGLIHRDIKPANIFVGSDGRAKLGDLGLVRDVEGGRGLTLTRDALGTPAFMSPEQTQGSRDLDIRSDIYALGACLYTLLTGMPPFQGDSVYAVIQQVNEAEIPDARDVVPGVSAATAEMLTRALAKDRRARFQTPAELLTALSDIIGSQQRPVVSGAVPVVADPVAMLRQAGIGHAVARGGGVVEVVLVAPRGPVLIAAAYGAVPGEALRRRLEAFAADPADLNALIRTIHEDGLQAAVALVDVRTRTAVAVATPGARAVAAVAEGTTVLRVLGSDPMPAQLGPGQLLVLSAGAPAKGLPWQGALVAACDRAADTVAQILASAVAPGALVVVGG